MRRPRQPKHPSPFRPRSAPRIVSGRNSDRCTRLIRLASAICFSLRDAGASAAGKKPRQEIHRCDGHSDAKEHAGKHTLRAAFTEGKGETGQYNGNEGEAASDGAGESLLQYANGVFPRRSSRLAKGRSREK